MKIKRRIAPILLAFVMAFTMMPVMGAPAYAENEGKEDSETYTLTFHWSSIDGVDIDGQPAIKYTNIKPGTTIADVLKNDGKFINYEFYEKDRYKEWGKGWKPLEKYSSISDMKVDYPDENTVINDDMDIYCHMFKYIEEVTVTVKPPLCGVKTDTEKAPESVFGWNFFSQSNRPIITLPKDAAYMAIPEDPNTYMFPATWWSEEDWHSVYRGKFESGKPYNFTIFLTPKMGWIFDSGKEDLIKLEGGEILNHFVEFELYIQGVTKAVHNWKGATCTEPDRCKGCGVTQGKALGHAYGSWTKLNATQHHKVCEHDKSHVVKENHKWDAGKVTKKATEKQVGKKTYTCTFCKATKTETIPKLKPSAPKTSGTPLAKATAKKKSLTIGWNKIKGAEGYDIFFATCNHNGKKIACKNVKTIKGNKTFKWTKSGLRKGTAYKFYVRAYITKNGKKTYVSKTPMFHAYTGNGTKNFTSARSVTIRNVKKGKLSFKKGKTFKIKAKINKVNKKKKLMPKGHAPALRYMTTNKKIAKVSKKGMIIAKGKGTCTVIVFAHNGVSKSIKVTVK